MARDDGRRAENSNQRMVVLDLRRKFEFLADYLNFGRTVTALADGLPLPRRTLADAVREGGCTRRLHEDLQEAIREHSIIFDPTWPEWRDPLADAHARRDCRNDTLERFVERFRKENLLRPSDALEEDDVVIIINRSYEEFTEAEQEKFLQGIEAFLKTGRNIRVKRKEPGSVKLTVGLTEEEFLRLRKLFEEGKLDDLDVKAVRSLNAFSHNFDLYRSDFLFGHKEGSDFLFGHKEGSDFLFGHKEGSAGRIFISYRRDDVPAAARALGDGLARLFGADAIVMGLDYTQPGQRTERELAKTFDPCNVLIAVIGPRWLELLRKREQKGGPDYVCEEIREASRRGMTVIPVLVNNDDEPMLSLWELPEDMHRLFRYSEKVLTWNQYSRIDFLLLGKLISYARPPRPRRRKTFGWQLLLFLLAALTLAPLLVYWLLKRL
jgi:hypothetical protein